VLGKMLHELAHMEVWSHSEAFYSLLDELTHEYTELTRPLWLEPARGDTTSAFPRGAESTVQKRTWHEKRRQASSDLASVRKEKQELYHIDLKREHSRWWRRLIRFGQGALHVLAAVLKFAAVCACGCAAWRTAQLEARSVT
jgi:hypothetical protein